MFCSQCGFNNRDDAKFCKSCGKPLSVSNVQTDTQQHVQKSMQQYAQSGRQQAQPVQNNKVAPVNVNEKAKPKGGGFLKKGILIAAVAVVGIFVLSLFGGKGGGGGNSGGGNGTLPEVEQTKPVTQTQDSTNNIKIDASKQSGSKAKEFKAGSSREDAMIEFADRLIESGDAEAAQAVYSMIPRAALSDAAKDQSKKVEEYDSGAAKMYRSYDELKGMYNSVFGKEAGQ